LGKKDGNSAVVGSLTKDDEEEEVEDGFEISELLAELTNELNILESEEIVEDEEEFEDDEDVNENEDEDEDEDAETEGENNGFEGDKLDVNWIG
jgi:hypothetical protein